MAGIRVVHYLNQFFAGIGGEEQAGAPPVVARGPLGPGRLLQQALGAEGEVVATVYCGDNYVNERPDDAVRAITAQVAEVRADLLIAGPAFGSGRYGMGCGRVCAAVADQIGIPAVSGMSPDNPATEVYRARLYIVPTGAGPAQMTGDMERMVRLGLRLARGTRLGSADEEGYVPRGLRFTEPVAEPVGERAVRLLLARLNGRPFRTEWPLPRYDRVPPARPLPGGTGAARIAVVTSGGIVPRGNPDRLESAAASKWVKYPIADATQLTPDGWESIHGGYDTTNANADPNRVLPLDAIRALAAEGAIGELYPFVYITTGNQTGLERAQAFGRAIAGELAGDAVDAALLVAT